MERFTAHLSLIGRMLLAALFILSAFNKIRDPAGTQQYMAMMGMTAATTFFYLAAIVVELSGGLSVLFGYWARLGALVLFLFLIPTTLIFHANFADQNQMIHFLKNLTIMGGLLYVIAYGAGRFSMDARLGLTVEEPTVGTLEEGRRFGATGT